jgi:hypothetical protein
VRGSRHIGHGGGPPAAAYALGGDRVTRTPDWRSMIPEDFESIIVAMLAGERLDRYPTAR